MSNDEFDNRRDDRAMFRKLQDQETTMNNDDEATTCDRCGGRLIAGEGDGRYCGPCTNTPDDDPRLVTRELHRAEALRLADMAGRSDPEFAPGLGFAALTHAVLALSAPASPEQAKGFTTHTGMLAHDGFVPHSHEVRPDHYSVRREPPNMAQDQPIGRDQPHVHPRTAQPDSWPHVPHAHPGGHLPHDHQDDQP